MQTNIFILYKLKDFSDCKSIKYISNIYMHAYYFFKKHQYYIDFVAISNFIAGDLTFVELKKQTINIDYLHFNMFFCRFKFLFLHFKNLK